MLNKNNIRFEMNKTNGTELLKLHISKEEMSKNLQYALKNNLINEDDTAVIFYDIEYLKNRINHVKQLFPANALHAVAVKANSLINIVDDIKSLGIGIEVASSSECYIAQQTGYESSKIVFDSPVKTIKEIEYALNQGIYLNADSFDELDRIDGLLKSINSKSKIGIRVNPQVGAGTIKSTSVADSISKFGISMNDNSEKLKEYFLNHNWLNGIHAHIGSQGCPIELLMKGIKKVWDFVQDVNNTFKANSIDRRIEVFDIGGGMPVSYYENQIPVSMEEYKNLLKENMPELFTDKYKIITEFGRYIHANTSWVASRIEYVKREKNCNIIMTHVGSDLFLNKCYHPQDWHFDFSIVDKNGNLKTGKDNNKYIIAGPLCFAGDIVDTNIELPEVEAGDYLLIHDTGAYTLSVWSKYNSRLTPKVIAYNNTEFNIIKNRESFNSIFEFWR